MQWFVQTGHEIHNLSHKPDTKSITCHISSWNTFPSTSRWTRSWTCSISPSTAWSWTWRKRCCWIGWKMLDKMEKGLDGLREMETELDDLAFWICSARSLLAGAPVPCAREVEAKVAEYLGYVGDLKVTKTQPFGKSYREDFSQFKPRGHYTKSKEQGPGTLLSGHDVDTANRHGFPR